MYIKQNVQGSYELATPVILKKKSYLLTLKSFLISNGFELVSEDYSDANSGNLVLQIGNMQYDFKVNSSNNNWIVLTISKLLDNDTVNTLGNAINIELTNLSGTVTDGTTTRPTAALSSTVLLIKNKNSFILIITASANSITLASNYVTGNIVYTLVDGTKSDIGFVCNGSINNNFTAIEKLQGNPVTFNVAHNRLNDDRLIFENKLSVNQSGLFVGDSDEVVGLVGTEKGKIYQTDKGKFLAFATDMGILMGDEV